ncbi:PspA/IM30 family protein [Alkalimarinus sediminis]|uniref:PspA/IM30 family protein n=1 Tax=Alkalimarinus sediminis TaxID=1632866 RepID=A0A9E8HHF4_9ALTE|nr:PspA/IM30 family protein [Alkalimarinus sediminis]UZW74350.1 PspA/IM30 family protein [Alkalimarinus sediminis]
MNVMRKIATALRGSVRESAEVVIDANAIRIFEQEIVDAEQGIARSKQQLAYVMAERVQLERANSALRDQILSREQQIAKALVINDEVLASELAEDILEKEQIVNEQLIAVQNLTTRERNLTRKIQLSGQQIKTFRRELGIAKATASAQSASRLAGSHTNSVDTNIIDLTSSLQRIKQQQQRIDDTSDAIAAIENEIGDGALDKKVESAGLGTRKTDIQSILERVKKV